jgi:hypothetical protein
MTEIKEITEILDERIEEIQKQVISGKINLLDYELAPLFTELKNALNMDNLNNSSKTYKDACVLLNQKFDELKKMLSTLDSEQKFFDYLKSNPKDEEISQLFNGCWRQVFKVDSMSLSFLEFSKNKLCKERGVPITIEHLDKVFSDDEFLLEIPERNFTEKMTAFFKDIQKRLPCLFEEIFGKEQDQAKIYELFVYLLHLLQLGKIKYQKETNTLYI